MNTDLQSDYDDQTNGEKIESMQNFWNSQIKSGLNQYKESPALNLNHIYPKKQLANGINPFDIQCDSGRMRVVKNDESMVSRVTPAVAEKLTERNWGQIVSILRINS